jgi:glycosyltransferase involved in cell wall biosynthesis
MRTSNGRATRPPAVGRIAIVVDRYPCLSESFVRRELSYLASHGFVVAIVVCSPMASCDTWLEVGACGPVFRADGCRSGWRALRHLNDTRRLFPASPRGVWLGWRTATIAAAVLPRLAAWKPDWIHAHFMGVPAASATLLSGALGVPFSVSAHARDVFVPVARLDAICDRARFVAACSEHARAALVMALPLALKDRVVRVPHGVACAATLPERYRPADAPLRLLSVCRLVPKKGIDVVLRALARLTPEVRYRYRLVGGGPELPRLRALALELGVGGVEFAGPLTPAAVAAELADADLFVLGTRRAADGDRDGIPNAVLEAMAAGVPVVASDAGGISEAVRDRLTGWTPAADDPLALAAAIREAAVDPAGRRAIAIRAHALVRRHFSIDRNGELLARRLREELAQT